MPIALEPVGHVAGQYFYENHKIVTILFDLEKNQALRDQFFACQSDDAVRDLLAQFGIKIDDYRVRFMLVDIENARTWQAPNKAPIDAKHDLFYVYIMPPVPRRTAPGESEPSAGYKDMQAWEEAWHHAICDGYGM
jgi:hypothetical protein